ncbi:MAG: hypothetical protein V4508_13250 [Pseudomonadota bacterium]
MNDPFSERMRFGLVVMIFFASLFLMFTPFEGASQTMFPKYFSAGVAAALLFPLVVIGKIRLKIPSVLVLVALATILFHGLLIRPAPIQFNILIFINVMLAVMIYEASLNWRSEFIAAVYCLLFVNIALISVQALLFYVLSQDIYDFHKLIFGSPSRFVEDYLNVARFSGLQVEPGTYANYMACLLAIMILAGGASKKSLLVSFLCILSILLTNSGSSFYFVPVLLALIALVWKSQIRWHYILILMLSIGIYLYFSGIVSHLESRFLEHDDGSMSHRIEGIDVYLATGMEDRFLGLGYAIDPCVRCFYQDIGVVFNLVTRGGVIVTLALMVLMLRSLTVNGFILSFVLMLVPLNEKMFFYEAPIWIFILFAITGVAHRAPAPLARRPAHETCAGFRQAQ